MERQSKTGKERRERVNYLLISFRPPVLLADVICDDDDDGGGGGGGGGGGERAEFMSTIQRYLLFLFPRHLLHGKEYTYFSLGQRREMWELQRDGEHRVVKVVCREVVMNANWRECHIHFVEPATRSV